MDISDEYQKWFDKLNELDRTGRWSEGEQLAKQLLEHIPDQNLIRVQCLDALALCQMRLSKLDEAIDSSYEGLQIAHAYKNGTFLAWLLDRRAQIYFFMENHPKALLCLAAAENYMNETNSRDLRVTGRIAQTRGMIYASCGWWEKGAENLRRAAQIFEYLRLWDEWGTVLHDTGTHLLALAESEGVDLVQTGEAIQFLTRAIDLAKLSNNEPMTLQSTINLLLARRIMANFDVSELRSILADYDLLLNGNVFHAEWPLQRENSMALLSWISGRSQVVRALVNYIPRDHQQQLLDEQETILRKMLHSAPSTGALWQELSALARCRAVLGLGDQQNTVRQAAIYLIRAMDMLRHETLMFEADIRLRAGWLATQNHILENLAATAYVALHVSRPPETSIAVEMIQEIQFLRTRRQQDMVRSLNHLKQLSPHERVEIQALVNRIRVLQWYLRQHAGGLHLNRGLGAVPDLSDAPSLFTLDDYPEYQNRSRADLEDALNACKTDFEHYLTGKRFLQVQVKQLIQEGPLDIKSIQQNLRANDVVLDYYLGVTEPFVGIITSQDIDILHLPIDSIRSLYQLTSKISLLADTALMQRPTEVTLSLPEILKKLGGWLFPDDLVSHLAGVQRMYVSASGPIWQLPFPWLYIKNSFALEKWEVSLVPSARLAGYKSHSTSRSTAVAIGHSGMSSISVQQEVDLLRNFVPDCQILLNQSATPLRVLHQVLPKAEVVHFACHGLSDPITPLMSCLQLEPDEQHPDGRLPLYEILDIPLHADLVNLSACQTARSEGVASFPESLAHTFLGAGAHAVIASLWAANDEECLRFNHHFYDSYRIHPDPIAAFHQAQLQQLKVLHSQLTSTYPETVDLARVAGFVLFTTN